MRGSRSGLFVGSFGRVPGFDAGLPKQLEPEPSLPAGRSFAGARVVVVQTRLPRYREPVFEALRAECLHRGVEFDLVHGQAAMHERTRGDEGALPWALKVENRYLTMAGTALVWQQLPSVVRRAELVILSQENRILSNYPLLLRRGLGGQRVGYFGHGRNFQSAARSNWRERFKTKLATRVDWWFAYTELSAAHLRALGFPAERITCVDNAMDVTGLRRELAAVSDADLAALRGDLGIPATAPVGLYCGALYAEKRLDLLLEAAQRVRAQLPDFHLLVLGDGPLGAWLRRKCTGLTHVHVLGPRYGAAKAACFRLASVVLNPGLVGLHVLDAFAAGLPLVTTQNAHHSPEIAYLDNGRNGLLTEAQPQAYAAAVAALLGDEDTRSRMARAAAQAADRYSVEHMAERFADGIARCLAAPALRGRT